MNQGVERFSRSPERMGARGTGNCSAVGDRRSKQLRPRGAIHQRTSISHARATRGPKADAKPNRCYCFPAPGSRATAPDARSLRSIPRASSAATSGWPLGPDNKSEELSRRRGEHGGYALGRTAASNEHRVVEGTRVGADDRRARLHRAAIAREIYGVN